MNHLLESKRFDHSYYIKEGTGSPLILLHGFGESSAIFENQISFLKQFYTVIVPDIPGSGQSSLPSEEMSMELIADFVSEIIAQEHLQPVILLGHSMGGYAALAFAEKYPDQLTAFGLIHSTAFKDDEAKLENRRKSIRLIKNDGKEVFLKAMIPNLYSDKSKEKIPHEIAKHLTDACAITSESLVSYIHAMINRPDRTTVLKSTILPVLFVIGKDDSVVPYADMLTQSTFAGVSTVELFEGIGHTSMIECPQKVNDVLNNFCKYVLQNKIA